MEHSATEYLLTSLFTKSWRKNCDFIHYII